MTSTSNAQNVRNPGSPSLDSFSGPQNQYSLTSKSEVKEALTLEVENFSAFLSKDNKEMKEHGLAMHCGHYLGIHSDWQFYLQKDQKYLQAFLELNPETLSFTDPMPAETDKVKAKFQVIFRTETTAPESKIFIGKTDVKDFKAEGPNGNKDFIILDLQDLKALLDNSERDYLKLEIQVTLYNDDFVMEQTKSVEQRTIFQRKLVSDFYTALESGAGADLVLKVPEMALVNNGKEFENNFHTRSVHKSILAARSPVLAEILSRSESNTSSNTNATNEAKNEIILQQITKMGLDVILKYIYTGEVSADWVKIPEDVIGAAKRYQLSELNDFFDESLGSLCNQENALEMYRIAKKFELPRAEKSVSEFAAKNVKDIFLEKAINN